MAPLAVGGCGSHPATPDRHTTGGASSPGKVTGSGSSFHSSSTTAHRSFCHRTRVDAAAFRVELNRAGSSAHRARVLHHLTRPTACAGRPSLAAHWVRTQLYASSKAMRAAVDRVRRWCKCSCSSWSTGRRAFAHAASVERGFTSVTERSPGPRQSLQAGRRGRGGLGPDPVRPPRPRLVRACQRGPDLKRSQLNPTDRRGDGPRAGATS
jgi:hypothetical protein